MQRRTITVTVDQDGAVKTDYTHFAGAACLAEGERLHALLAEYGVQVNEATKTPKPELLAALDEQTLTTGLEASHTVEMGE
jgi:hypothetical protein